MEKEKPPESTSEQNLDSKEQQNQNTNLEPVEGLLDDLLRSAKELARVLRGKSNSSLGE